MLIVAMGETAEEMMSKCLGEMELIFIGDVMGKILGVCKWVE